MAPTMNLLRRSSKHQDFVMNFFREDVIITSTASPSLIGRWVKNVVEEEDCSFVGIGVQWSSESSAADTLQLCVNNKCLVVQLKHCSRIPKRLTRFLASKVSSFAGIWNARDSKKLLARSDALKIRNLVDVRDYMGSLRNRSVSDIVWEGLDEHYLITPRIEITKSDWSKLKLDREQIIQAAIGALVSYKLAHEHVPKDC